MNIDLQSQIASLLVGPVHMSPRLQQLAKVNGVKLKIKGSQIQVKGSRVNVQRFLLATSLMG